MMSSSSTQRRIDVVPLFDGKDFTLWKLRAEAVFMANDLLDMIEKDVLQHVMQNDERNTIGGGVITTSSNTKGKQENKHENKEVISERDEIRKRSHQAYGMLLQALPSEQLRLIQHIQRGDAHGVWKTLLETYERKSMATKVQLLEQLFSLQKRKEESISSYVAQLTQLERKLGAQGEAISESILIYVMLRGLPNSYITITQLIKMKEKLDMKETIELLKSEEERQSTHGIIHMKVNNDNGTMVSGMNAQVSNKDISHLTCYTCNQYGHKKYDCPNNKSKLKCNLCKKVGHRERNCWTKDSGKKIESNNSADVIYATAY